MGKILRNFSLLPPLQVEMFNRENAQLQGLLQRLQVQPQAVRLTPSSTSYKALRNDTAASGHESSAAGAPNQASGPGNAQVTVDSNALQELE